METGLQAYNKNSRMMLWAERIEDCRNSHLSVKVWFTEHGICPAAFYKWQRKLFALAKDRQDNRFTEVTPARDDTPDNGVAVILRINGIQADVHNGADMSTVEAVLQFIKSC